MTTSHAGTVPRPEWLGIRGLAQELGFPTRTIYAWRTKGKGPGGYRLGKHVRIRRDDVEAWLAQRAEPEAS